jgi:GGDEF domain-containing protein
MGKVAGYLAELIRRVGAPSDAVPSIDRLTGLPTRSAVIAELARALSKHRHKAPVGLLIIEFSSMLESGEPDTPPERALIAQLGLLLRSWIPLPHVVGHLRDREFAVLVHNLTMGEVEHLADDVVERIRSDASLESRRGQIATIVGVGYSRDAEASASQLMSLADIALHYALATGRSWHAIVDKRSVPRAA